MDGADPIVAEWIVATLTATAATDAERRRRCERLWAQVEDRLAALCRHLCLGGPPEFAAELRQRVAVRFLERIDQLRADSSVWPWVAKIAHGKAAEMFKEQAAAIYAR